MKKSILLAAVLAAVSTVAQADNTPAQKAAAVPPAKAAKPAPQATIRPVRLSDAELDQVVAGTAFVIHGGGTTIVLNPGNALVGPKSLHKNLVCVNCF
jgi:hypothetical protein